VFRDGDDDVGGGGGRSDGEAFFGVEVGGGDLEGEEEVSGALVIEDIAGDAIGDLGDSVLDGVAIEQFGEFEAVGGTLDDGCGAEAVGVAEVVSAHGGGGTTVVIGEVVVALVRLLGCVDEFLFVGHKGSYPPPGGGLWKTWVKWKSPAECAGLLLFSTQLP